jgi:hypothetical protein
MTQKAPLDTRVNWLALLLALFLAFPVGAYDDIAHSASAIRDAYFLGTREGGVTPEILAHYTHWIPELKEGTCTSQARLETPFLQVADYAGEAVNYSSQGAVKEFYGKQMIFRVYLDICYKPKAPLNAIKIKVIQNKKEITLSEESSPYIPQVTELATLLPMESRYAWNSNLARSILQRLPSASTRLTNSTAKRISTCKLCVSSSMGVTPDKSKNRRSDFWTVFTCRLTAFTSRSFLWLENQFLECYQ